MCNVQRQAVYDIDIAGATELSGPIALGDGLRLTIRAKSAFLIAVCS